MINVMKAKAPMREPVATELEMAPLLDPDEPEADGLADEPDTEPVDLAAGRVEVMTEEVAGILVVAVPFSTVK